MFMPNDGRYGGDPPMQQGGQPFDLQARLAQLPPEIRVQVMARMGMPGGGMQAGLPDQGMNQTGPMPPGQGGMQPNAGWDWQHPQNNPQGINGSLNPPRGGMQAGLPGQGAQSGPMGNGGNSAIDPRTGQPWDRNIGPTARSRVLSQQQPTAASGSAIPGSSDVPQNIRDLWANGGWSPSGDAGFGGAPTPVFRDHSTEPRNSEFRNRFGGAMPVDPGFGRIYDGDPRATPVKPGDGGPVLNTMPAPVARPIGNARPARPQMSAADRASAIAADKAMVGGAPPYVGKPKPMPQTDPPVAGTATDVKPLVGKPAPSPQQDPLQGNTKPKPKPKPTLGRNYGPK